MPNEKPLTKSELLSVLKKADFATQKDVHKTVLEATDAVLIGVEKLLEKFATKNDVKKIDRRLNKLETGQSYIKDQINNLDAELSSTPSRREFNKLKTKVDHYHPAN